MKRSAWIFPLMMFVLSLGIPVWAEPGFSTKILAVHAGGFPNIALDLLVYSRDPLPALTHENLVIQEDGDIVDEFTVTPGTPRRFFVLALDRSEQAEPFLPDLKKAVVAFVNAMPEDAQMAVVTFGSDVTVGPEFTSRRADLENAIVGMRADGGRSLYDALFQGCALLGKAARPGDVATLICLTAGKDSRPAGSAPMSVKTVDQALEAATNAAVRVIMVGLGPEVDGGILKTFADKTQGGYLPVPVADQLPLAGKHLSERFRRETSVTLAYASPNPRTDGSVRRLTVVSAWQHRKDRGTASYGAPLRAEGPRVAAGSRTLVGGRVTLAYAPGVWTDDPVPSDGTTARDLLTRKEAWRRNCLEKARAFATQIREALSQEPALDRAKALQAQIAVLEDIVRNTPNEAEKQETQEQVAQAREELARMPRPTVDWQAVPISGDSPVGDPDSGEPGTEPEPQPEPEPSPEPEPEPEPPPSDSGGE